MIGAEWAPLDLMSLITWIELDPSFTLTGSLSAPVSAVGLLYSVIFLPSCLSLLSFSLTPPRAVKSLAMFSQKWVTPKQSFLGCEGWARMDLTLR